MTEEQIKEQLSRRFLEIIANRAGFKCLHREPDHGVDLTVVSVAARLESSGRHRLIETGKYLDVQLKCTCEASVVREDGVIKYDLEAKTYNDLVYRAVDEVATPMVLVLLILPDAETEWLQVSADDLVIRRHAYWYQPEMGAAPTTNTGTKRITIPRTNAVGLTFVRDKIDEYYG